MIVTSGNGARKRRPFDDAFKKEDGVPRTSSSSARTGGKRLSPRPQSSILGGCTVCRETTGAEVAWRMCGAPAVEPPARLRRRGEEWRA